MFGIGSTELLIILLVALIVLGPKSLAGVAKSLGKAMGEFRRVSTDFQRTLNMEAAQAEAKEAEDKNRKDNQSASDKNNLNDNADEILSKLPPDSPVAQAIAKARASANGTTQEKSEIRDKSNV